jgi:hypothetical protein
MVASRVVVCQFHSRRVNIRVDLRRVNIRVDLRQRDENRRELIRYARRSSAK